MNRSCHPACAGLPALIVGGSAVVAGLFMAASRLSAVETPSAVEAWPLAIGTVWIYEGTSKWTEDAGSIRFRWTNEVEWSATSARRTVAVVRGSLHLLGFDKPDPAAPPTVFVAESNQVHEIHTQSARAAYALADALLDGVAPLPENAMELLNLPLRAGKDFDVDASAPPRDDHWYCWHVEKVESRRLKIRGTTGSNQRQVATLAYRTNPDHQLAEFVPGLGVLSHEAVHHGSVGELKMRLVEFHDGRAREAMRVRVSEVTLFGDMDCLRIETQVATYLYGKRGAGFASILDPDGHDWISYRHGGKALGEYRSLPKCGQPVKYFHCGYGFGQYTNNNPFTTTVQQIARDHVRVHSETQDGSAACDWDFFSTHVTMTLHKIPGHYWFLYEGTPGGQLDVTEDFVERPGDRRNSLAEPWVDEIPWMFFGAKESPFGLLLVAHQPSPPASCVAWPYKPEPDGGLNQMTVAGFGRPGWQDPNQHTPPLEKLPARFSIAVSPTNRVAQRAEELFRSVK